MWCVSCTNRRLLRRDDWLVESVIFGWWGENAYKKNINLHCFPIYENSGAVQMIYNKINSTILYCIQALHWHIHQSKIRLKLGLLFVCYWTAVNPLEDIIWAPILTCHRHLVNFIWRFFYLHLPFKSSAFISGSKLHPDCDSRWIWIYLSVYVSDRCCFKRVSTSLAVKR